MKFFDKLVLKIFSIIIIALTITVILVMTNVLSINSISAFIIKFTDYENGLKILIVCLAVLMLLAIKGLFFTSKPNTQSSKDGIILENSSGKLIISKESLENLIHSVVKDVPGAETVMSKTFLDKDKNLIVYVTVIVSKDVMLKDITMELQNKVKDAMKKTADLDVKEVNIKIRNISSKKIKGLPEPSTSEIEQDENDVNETNIELNDEENNDNIDNE